MKRPIKFTKWLLLAIPLVLLLVPAAASAEITNASITCNAGTVQASYYPSIDPVTAYQTVTIPLTVNGTKDEIVEASKFSLVKQHSYNVNIVASDFQLPADGDNSFSIQLNVQKGSASEPLPSAETICLYYNNLAITDTFQLERTHLAPRTGNLMTGFSINGIAGRINDSQNTIYVDVPYNATLETLAPVFTVSDGASVYVNGIKQASNSSTQSFTASTTSPVQYVVIAENNTSTKTYSVTVQQSANTACDILTFELPEQDHVVIDNTAGTIVVHMKSDTSFISTKPTQLVISDGATIDHPQTEFRDFSATTPVSYIVTSQDGKHSKEYKVTLGMPTSVGSSAAAITSYTLLIDGIRYTGIINESNKTVIVTLPAGVTNTTGVATYTLSTGATAQVGTVTQVNGSTSNSFASPQTYTITAQDGTTTANYTV
ncbi:MAG: hypothetical protein PHO41_10080, partial [Eubacteriales bacterium]|nr:hypothetical protein [Eubacteriales bacterium]